jgi:hypothetical protein
MTKEDRDEVINAYNKIKDKYKLPTIEEFETEFEVRLQVPILRHLLMIMTDHFGWGAGHVEKILHPAHMYDMMETKFHTEDEKKELFKKYQELCSYLHEISLSFYLTPEERGKTIMKALKYYKESYKPFIQKMLKEHTEKWKEETKEEKKESYLG